MNQAAMHSAETMGAVDVPQLDSLHHASEAVDSLSGRIVSAQELFGPQSQLIEAVEQSVESQTLVGDTFFQLSALFMLFVVLFFIARHHHRIGAMFGRMVKGRLAEDYSSGRREESITRSFVQSALVIGIMLITLFVVKYSPMWLPESMTPSEGWTSIVAMFFTLLFIAAVGIFEHLLLFMVGKVTRSEEIVSEIVYIKRAGFSLAAISLSPVFLMGVLSAEKMSDMWNIILIVQCSILVLLFLKETLAFFIEKKIPIFHWFLYLCTAEVFPLTLIWALIVRS